MKGYMKLTAALAAFALLLVVMGLSTAGSVNAQQAVTVTATNEYVCSNTTGCTQNTSDIDLDPDSETGTIEVKNLDVAEVEGINPRSFTDGTTLEFVQQFDPDNDDGSGAGIFATAGDGIPDTGSEIRAFNGNRIQLMFQPTSGFATFKTITVDNVKPTLVINSPTDPLVVKGNTDITFSADMTDTGAGYTDDGSGVGSIAVLTATAGGLATGTNDSTPVGGVRLVVAGNVVDLKDSNFTAIDGGWNVWATINSSAIQNIGANVPWYFETRDLAGNTRRTSSTVALRGAMGADTIIDTRFIGGLPAGSFIGSTAKVTRGSESKNVPIRNFDMTSGQFTLTLAVGDFFDDDDTTSDVDESMLIEDDKVALNGSSLVTVDSKAPRLESGGTITGIRYDSAAKEPVRGLKARANSVQVKFDDDGKNDNDNAGSGLDASSVTPGAFTVSGNSVSSVQVVGNDVYLTLAENLGPDEQPRIVIASASITDKAGNAFGGATVSKAGDGLGPNLGLSKSGDLSDEEVVVTISTDEQLGALPTVSLSRVIDGDGNFVGQAAMVCDNTDTADETELVAVPSGHDTDAAACTSLNVTAAPSADPPVVGETYVPIADPRRPAGSFNPSQTGALSYRYAVDDAANPTGTTGGKYNVYVTGVDTQTTDNISSVGNSSGANNVGAFTFQIDTALNGGGDPTVTVAEETASASDGDIPDVEAVDPMIVTVDWAGESNEYDGDSYRTVELTSAVLKVTFDDGTSETTTYNLTTEVSTADNIKFTIPVLNPKVGAYTLTVKGTDSAGNASGTSGHVSKWNVVAAKPVNISLEPGWNLISLPFQPGNPAINSVIPASHPADIVMTFDNASQTWLVARRDAETGLFVGDIPVMTANTAYFVRTDKFQAIKLLRPALATAAAAPPPPPAITVVEGWNLVPIVSNDIPTPTSIPADDYFGTLGDKGWLKALTFNTLVRTWDSVTPGNEDDVTVGKGYWLYATASGVIIP